MIVSNTINQQEFTIILIVADSNVDSITDSTLLLIHLLCILFILFAYVLTAVLSVLIHHGSWNVFSL